MHKFTQRLGIQAGWHKTVDGCIVEALSLYPILFQGVPYLKESVPLYDGTLGKSQAIWKLVGAWLDSLLSFLLPVFPNPCPSYWAQQLLPCCALSAQLL